MKHCRMKGNRAGQVPRIGTSGGCVNVAVWGENLAGTSLGVVERAYRRWLEVMAGMTQVYI